MKADFRCLLSLGFAVSLSLISIHLRETASALVIAGCLLISLLSLRVPALGVLAAFPLLVILQPTPTELSWRELGFATVLATTTAASAWQGRKFLWEASKRFYYAPMIALFLVSVNLFAAFSHEVSLHDWIRGLAPFAFLVFFVPVYLESRRYPNIVPWVIASMVSASMLFCWLVVSHYVSEQLWNPYHYVFEAGKWVRIPPDEVWAQSQPVFQFRARITQVLQQATDALIPAAFVWGSALVLWGSRPAFAAAGAAILSLSMVAIILTYTRSMLLAALIVTAMMIFVSLGRKGAAIRAFWIVCLSIVSAAVTIFAFDLVDIYLNRYLLLKQAFVFLSQYVPAFGEVTGSGSAAPHLGEHRLPEIKDENITSRLEEYRIAFAMFLEAPIFGQGLGVRHAINFATGHGDVIIANVGYVHNWIFYSLMVGGVLGIATSFIILLGPGLAALKRTDWPSAIRWPLIATTGLFAVYSLFFAVFRLIPFNLVLAGVWGLVLFSLSRNTSSQEGRA